jgi:hypothetical protein
MLYISICLTLLTLLASLLYLTKIKSEGLGMIHKLISWIVLLTAFTILICQVAQGVKRMLHHNGKCHGNETSCTITETGEGGMRIHKEIRKVRSGKHHEPMNCEVNCETTTGHAGTEACCSMHKSNCCENMKGEMHCGGKKMQHKMQQEPGQKIIKDSVVIIK